jgi:hemerythrin-like domain-containing protein
MITRRREFLLAGAALGIGGAAGRTLLAADAAQPAEDVSAVEDLMREHGVLRRVLLIYEECMRQLDAKANEAEILRASGFLHEGANLVQMFIEDYHEKLEEQFLFPEFEKRNKLVPLVKVLKEQHAMGRALTQSILSLMDFGESHKTFLATPKLRQKAVECCKAFIRMYRPHAAREDTLLFPALREILSAKQLDQLGDKFEKEENRRFGAHGFAEKVALVGVFEKYLGIYDLGQFTPKPTK